MTNKIIIIGGSAGGATAAARLRRLDENAEITIFEQGPDISYASCGLPYHLSGVIAEKEQLFVQTPNELARKFNLTIRTNTTITHIAPEKQIVTATVANNQTQDWSYDQLLIATGAHANWPPIEGLNQADNVFALKSVSDMDQILAYLDQKKVKTVTIAGGGAIGLEAVENLSARGLNIQLIEQQSQVLPNIDFELAQIVHAQLDLHHVQLFLNTRLTQIEQHGHQLVLSTHQKIPTDLTILALGVKPSNQLAVEASLELGTHQGILVNSQLQTSDPHIWAIGDVIEINSQMTNQTLSVPLAGPANHQARLVADAMTGHKIHYTGPIATSITKIFELTAASVGENEIQLTNRHQNFQVIHTHPNNHVDYYPNAAPLDLKILFDQDGTLLGAQCIGTTGVKERIDVLATSIHFKAHATDLANLELAYAPPFSTPKDPINFLGYIAENLTDNLVKTFSWRDVDQLVTNQAYFLDVREPDEIALGKIDNSHAIPLAQLREQLTSLPTDRPIYVYCQVGIRGYIATQILHAHGFHAVNLDGGYKTYKQSHYQIKTQSISPSVSSVNTHSNDPIPATTLEVDACGLQCPGPIMKVKKTLSSLSNGQIITVQASDFGFYADIEAWCRVTGNTLLDNKVEGNKVLATIQKGTSEGTPSVPISTIPSEEMLHETPQGATMIVFSGDLDKALASMIIANGAASMGKQVTIFFTFWGLNVLKKQKIKKHGLAKLFDIMLPNGAKQLPISKMNMGGMGSKMIQTVMQKKNVDPLPVMINKAREQGVKFVACTMSMGIMGIEREELYDFVDFGGVATYLGDAEQANLNLFL